MPFVTKHPLSPYWYAGFLNEQNQWVKKSTKKTNRADAWAVALELQRAAALGRDRTLTESIARDIIGDILERSCGETLRNMSLREFSTDWIKRKTAARQEGTSTRYKGTIDAFLEFMATKADRPIAAVTPTHCQKFYDYLVSDERGLAPASCVVEIKTLRGMFNSAFRMGLIKNNPASAVELPDRIKQVRRGTFTEAQVQLLLDTTTREDVINGAEWKTAILLAYFAGLRLGDAVTLDWQAVDFTNSVLKFTTRKTDDALEIPLHETLLKHLEEIAGDTAGPICPNLAAIPVSGRSGLSKQFLSLMKKADIDNKSAETGGIRKLSKLSFHALRASFNSALANKGVDQEIRMKLTGHKSDAVNNLYTVTELATLRDAIKKLPTLKV